MIKITGLFIASALAINCFGQGVAINTTGATPNPSAILDVNASDKGALMPRVKLTSTTDVATISTPAIGLMVYNTNANMTGGGIGFYYYTGARWVSFITCEGYDNLVVSATSSDIINITADKLCIGNMQLTNINVTADINNSGAGGLETVSSESSNTWYYIHVITDSIGNNVNALLSTSATAPTLPATHSQFRRVGAVRNDASDDFLPFDQEGNTVKFQNRYTVLNDGIATSWTDISLGAYLPSTSRRVYCELSLEVLHTTDFTTLSGVLRKKGGLGAVLNAATSIGTAPYYYKYPRVFGDVPTDANQTIQYLINIVPSGALSGVHVRVAGYYDRL